MGVEYLVLDKKNQRIFWLGKGPWWDLMAKDEQGKRIERRLRADGQVQCR